MVTRPRTPPDANNAHSLPQSHYGGEPHITFSQSATGLTRANLILRVANDFIAPTHFIFTIDMSCSPHLQYNESKILHVFMVHPLAHINVDYTIHVSENTRRDIESRRKYLLLSCFGSSRQAATIIQRGCTWCTINNVSFNNEPVSVLSLTQGVSPFPSLDLSSHVKLGANTLLSNVKNADPFSFVMILHITNSAPDHHPLSSTGERSAPDLSSRALLFGTAGNADKDDIEVQSQCLSLIDPIGRKRMVTPVRGVWCTHPACFERSTYIAINEKTPKWSCPICSSSAPLVSLRGNQQLEHALREFPNHDRVLVTFDGQLLAPTDDVKRSRKKANNSPIVLF